MIKQLTGGQLSTASTVSAETLSVPPMTHQSCHLTTCSIFLYCVLGHYFAIATWGWGKCKETDYDLRRYKTNKKMDSSPGDVEKFTMSIILLCRPGQCLL